MWLHFNRQKIVIAGTVYIAARFLNKDCHDCQKLYSLPNVLRDLPPLPCTRLITSQLFSHTTMGFQGQGYSPNHQRVREFCTRVAYPYTKEQNILIVGDMDFSFSLSVAQCC
ncbi:hypothetical protein HanPI659440_Chr12g0458771 [Helianthus annuus]|nr:hypothetical protein HanPI659440_Chr12g0458771 [Helianthus annuus]